MIKEILIKELNELPDGTEIYIRIGKDKYSLPHIITHYKNKSSNELVAYFSSSYHTFIDRDINEPHTLFNYKKIDVDRCVHGRDMLGTCSRCDELFSIEDDVDWSE